MGKLMYNNFHRRDAIYNQPGFASLRLCGPINNVNAQNRYHSSPSALLGD